MNETLSVIEERYSCRAYTGQLPQREALDAIAKAAVQSPSAVNRQPWQVVVITDKALIDEMDAEGMRIFSEAEDKGTYQRMMERGGKLYYNAPCMYLILQQPGTEMDTGIVSQNITLAATALGLGSVICGLAAIPFKGPKGEEFKSRIGFPEGYEFGIAVLVGHPVGEGTPHQPDTGKIRYL